MTFSHLGTATVTSITLAQVGEHALNTFYTSRAAYWDQVNIHHAVTFASDWDSDAAHRAYQDIAQTVPSLRGLFVLQYLPYAAGQAYSVGTPPPWNDLPVLTALGTVRTAQ